MLALFGIFLAALMGVAALALDVGVASLAQKRLETAAELVALERARGASEADLREQASSLLAEGPVRESVRVRLGPIGPLEAGDPGCTGSFPTESDGVATLARRIPLLFGQGSMLAFASPTTWREIQAARLDPADPNDPTPVLPDASIPPDTVALREQGLCVEGRGQATLVPALAVAGDEQLTLPGTETNPTGPKGLSILADVASPLWQSRLLTQETTCVATAQEGEWFELSTAPGLPCEPGDAICTVPIGSGTLRVDSEPGGLQQASLVPTDEPTDVDLHRAVVATVRLAGTNEFVGFATLCVRRVGTTTSVAMRWNDAAMPFAAFTAELHDSDVRAHWQDLKVLDQACRHPEDDRLRCLAQSAVLSLPGEDA